MRNPLRCNLQVVYERLWDAVWVHPQEVIDEGILISPRMTSDHYTTSLVGALQVRLYVLPLCAPALVLPAQSQQDCAYRGAAGD